MAELAVLTGVAEREPPVSEERVVPASGARAGCRGGAGALGWRPGAEP